MSEHQCHPLLDLLDAGSETSAARALSEQVLLLLLLLRLLRLLFLPGHPLPAADCPAVVQDQGVSVGPGSPTVYPCSGVCRFNCA
jgi:hypothetical protein